MIFSTVFEICAESETCKSSGCRYQLLFSSGLVRKSLVVTGCIVRRFLCPPGMYLCWEVRLGWAEGAAPFHSGFAWGGFPQELRAEPGWSPALQLRVCCFIFPIAETCSGCDGMVLRVCAVDGQLRCCSAQGWCPGTGQGMAQCHRCCYLAAGGSCWKCPGDPWPFLT